MSSMDFKTAVANWLAFQSVGKRPQTQKYLAEIAEIVSNRWLDHDQDISTVTETQLAAFLPLVAHYSPSRFNAVVSLLKRLFPLSAKSLKRARVKIKERANISQLQFAGLLAEADKLPRSHAGLVIDFLSHTGLRITEGRKLRWVDVRYDLNGFFVPGTISKNGKARFVPFVNGIRALLDRLKAVTGPTEFVLPRQGVRRGISKACQAAGVPHLSHHDFRHLFATRCIEGGVDLHTAARWLGHQDGGALLGKVYFHLADSHSKEMSRRVEI